MNCKVLAALGLSALVAAPAIAGLNPARPGLPPVTGAPYTQAMPNNVASAMCVDCHTVAPKPAATGGSHFVDTVLDGGDSTFSGGSGIDSGGNIAGREGGEYFKALNWTENSAAGIHWPSKYALGMTASVVNQVPTAALRTQPINATAQTLTGVEGLICESCHNIVGNEDGGNNLLAVQPANDFVNGPTAELCVGCHGFMYSNNAAVVTASTADVNADDPRNTDEVGGGLKGNNEYHWVRGTPLPQNHHVMTGDTISGTKAAAGALWTDNLIIAYADHTLATNYAGGTLPQKATWTGITRPTGTANMSCTSCHTPAHGFGASPAASILRNAVYTGAAGGGADIAGTQIDRIAERGGWKKIDDMAYCGQCHIQ